MSFKYKSLFILAPLIFLADQLTKHLIVQNFHFGERYPVIGGFFDIVHFTNRGAAFGLFSDANSSWRIPFFYIVSAVALIAIIIYIIKLPSTERMLSAAFSLVVGGILGNGVDRIRFGEVTDFLSVHIADKFLWGVKLEWPAFNVADSAITIAMILIVINALCARSSST